MNNPIKVPMQSLESLRRETYNSVELEKHIKIIIQELESKIREALTRGVSQVIYPIGYCEFQMVSFNAEETVKIILFNVTRILEERQYNFKLARNNYGYTININLGQMTGGELSKCFDSYLQKYF